VVAELIQDIITAERHRLLEEALAEVEDVFT
jgi:hypothetical protein